MLYKVHSCLGLDAFSPIDASASFCGGITHLGLPFCLVCPKEPCWDLFFVLTYINDISRDIMSDTKLFADFMKVYRVLRDILRKIWKSYK